MPATLELLQRALEFKKAARWCEDLDLDPSAMSQARKRGKLSPTLAASIAIELGEDPIQWAAIAGIEGDSNKPLQEHLLKSIKMWRKLSLSDNKRDDEILTEGRMRRFFDSINRALYDAWRAIEHYGQVSQTVKALSV